MLSCYNVDVVRKFYHREAIMWDPLFIMWEQMLSCGSNPVHMDYHVEAKLIMWGHGFLFRQR
jgi:hypothetical protein